MSQLAAQRKTSAALDSAGSMYFDWPNHLSLSEQEELLSVMNLVLETEDTIGFPEPLSWSDGMRVVGEQSKSIESGSKRVMLLRQENTNAIIGQLVLTPSSLPNCKHIAEISRVFVHPSFRGFAVLSGGMRAIIAECDRLGIEMLTLDVRANTRIHKLWEGLGFQSMGLMPDYARVNGQSYDGCYMYQSVANLKQKINAIASGSNNQQ